MLLVGSQSGIAAPDRKPLTVGDLVSDWLVKTAPKRKGAGWLATSHVEIDRSEPREALAFPINDVERRHLQRRLAETEGS
jgi:hypothetical protein